MDLIESLKKLDVNNDNHWTSNGLPRLETVKMLASNSSLTREQLEAEAPNFTRENSLNWERPPATAKTQPPIVKITPDPALIENEAKKEEAESVKDHFPKVHEGRTIVTPTIDELKEQLTAQIEKVGEIRLKKADIDRQYNEERQIEDDLRARVEAVFNRSQSDAQTTRSYLDSQLKIREERADKQKIIKESGIDLKELQRGLKAPIDDQKAKK